MESRNKNEDFVKFYFDYNEISDSANFMEDVRNYVEKLGINNVAYDFERHDKYLAFRFREDFSEQSYRGFSALCEYLFSGDSIPAPVSFEGSEDTEKVVESIRENSKNLTSKL